MTQKDLGIRNVSLRILRDGPTHNHLLSPLTAYLAAVGPYEAVSVRMPYEHRRLLRDLNSLRYGATATRGPDPSRITASDRRIIADDVGDIFAAVPGLTAEMATEAGCDGRLTHLCLVFSAAELSLLPFELASAPRGFPGEGQPISIQSIAPVVMTRAIPGATGKNCPWDRSPKVLFVTAQPPELPEVPVRAHLLALIKALKPWVGSTPTLESSKESEEFERILGQHLTVLPNATLADIEEQCRQHAFTHVHVLAHSQSFEEGSQTQFALALHSSSGGTELVSSERLQAALRLPMRRRAADNAFSHPLVVSLATCDSGNQAQVLFPTMSLAHALHAAGVPLVVGSLFPLSYRGSVVMTETLYSGLLQGRDPRRVLYDVRHDMFRADQQTHDWASLVAYASLPDDDELKMQIQSLAFNASNANIKANVEGGQRLIDSFISRKNAAPDAADPAALSASVLANDDAIDKVAKELPLTGLYVAEGRGSLASSAKRRAEILWNAATAVGVQTETGKGLLKASRERLKVARDEYVKASKAPRWMQARPQAQVPTMHWVMTQALSLTLVLGEPINFLDWWVAVQDADNYIDPNADPNVDEQGRDQEDVLWALASKAELALLAYGALYVNAPYTDHVGSLNETKVRHDALEYMRKHAELARAMGRPKLTDSTVRNLKRYTSWWFNDQFAAGQQSPNLAAPRIRELASELIHLLPALDGEIVQP